MKSCLTNFLLCPIKTVPGLTSVLPRRNIYLQLSTWHSVYSNVASIFKLPQKAPLPPRAIKDKGVSEGVDCEQSLLFPPEIVYRARKRKLHGEQGESPLAPFSTWLVLLRSVHNLRREKEGLLTVYSGGGGGCGTMKKTSRNVNPLLEIFLESFNKCSTFTKYPCPKKKAHKT